MNCRGMTLLEVMVAMAIFAIAGITLMETVTEQVVALATLEDKTFASWGADNPLVTVGAPITGAGMVSKLPIRNFARLMSKFATQKKRPIPARHCAVMSRSTDRANHTDIT